MVKCIGNTQQTDLYHFQLRSKEQARAVYIGICAVLFVVH